MNTAFRILLGFVVVSLIAVPASAWAGDPIIKYEEQTELEIDLGMVVEDLVPVLLGLGEAESEEWPEQLRQIMQVIGIPALDRLHMKSSTSLRESVTHMTITLKPGANGGFIGALTRVPPGRFRFGRYVDPDKTVAVASYMNFSEGLKELVTAIADGEVPIPGVVKNPDGSVTAGGINLHEDLYPHLRGELDFILFPLDPGMNPEVPNMTVVLGTPDGFALRDRLLDLAADLFGPEAAREMREAGGETASDFTFYPLHEQMFYGVSSDFFLITSDVERLKDMVKRPRRGIRAPEGRQYMRVDGDLLLDFLADAAEAEGANSDEERIQAQIMRSLGDEPIGVFEIKTSSRPGRLDMEMHQSGNILSLQYRVLRQYLALAGEMEAAEKRQAHYRDTTAKLDQAMTQYGIDHDGVFPETPEALVKKGYLDAFPDLTPTPLGKYVEGGYTYVPLRNDAGTVVGYFLFVYGGGENSGFDVFTRDNVKDPHRFRIGSDGKDDGVPSFCYDGVAIEQMESWGGGQ